MYAYDWSNNFSTTLSTETEKASKTKFKDKLFIGTGFNGGISLTQIMVGAKANIGYRIHPRFSFGIGTGYQYMQMNRFFSFPITSNRGYYLYQYRQLKYHAINPVSLWVQFNITKGLFLYSEYEYRIGTYKHYYSINDFKQTTHIQTGLLLGGGLQVPFSKRTNFQFLLLNEVLDFGNKPLIYRGNKREYSHYGRAWGLRLMVNFNL